MEPIPGIGCPEQTLVRTPATLVGTIATELGIESEDITSPRCPPHLTQIAVRYNCRLDYVGSDSPSGDHLGLHVHLGQIRASAGKH